MITALQISQLREGSRIVGRYFAGYSNATETTAIFCCESVEPKVGYWLVNIADATDRALVFPSQLGTTYPRALDRGDHWYVWRLGERIPKPALAQVA